MRPLILCALLAFAAPAAAQTAPKAGPVIHSAGAVFAVTPDLRTPTDIDYKVAFEIAQASPGPDQVSVGLNSVARFMNMHAQAGVPRERIRTAIVVHGPAGWDLLNDEAHRARAGAPNPNAELLRELIAFGTPVILCGQTAASRGIPTDQLLDGVQVALSAMTAFVLLQDEGYLVNPW